VLGQVLDQLQVLEGDGGLAGDRGGDLAGLGVGGLLAGKAQGEESQELVGRNQGRDQSRGRHIAPQELGQAAAVAGVGAAAGEHDPQVGGGGQALARPGGG